MANRSSLGRSTPDLVPDASGSTFQGSDGQRHSAEGANDYHSPVSSEDVSPAISTVLKSDVWSQIGLSMAYFLSNLAQIAINTLLNRLKQSVASVREFGAFLKKRSVLEEDHAQGLKKLCKTSHENAQRPDNRQGSYLQSYNEVIHIHDRMAENGIQFALNLHQMQEHLVELTANIERGRRHWKQTGLSAEKRVQEAESMLAKAKAKYDSLAEDYDRARTGDKQTGRVFGLKGPKSAAQHEEDLHRKVQAADSEYSTRVQAAQSQRQELKDILRPQATKAIQDLINECDAGLTMQLQRFASFNEKMLLSNGLCVSPLSGQNTTGQSQSLRDIVHSIDNSRDLHNYLASHISKVGPKPQEIRYQPHPTLTTPQQAPSPINARAQPPQGPPPQFFPVNQGELPPPGPPPGQSMTDLPRLTTTTLPPIPSMDDNDFLQQQHQHLPPPPQHQNFVPIVSNNPPQIPPYNQSIPTMYGQSPSQIQSFAPDLYGQPSNQVRNFPVDNELPPLKPVFGVSLEEMLQRDGSAIPLIVYQCLQAVDLFGLRVEGIYRASGSAVHVSKLRAIFNHDSSQVDFRNPEHFFHDVNSVAGLLKAFFRELSDPLLTREKYVEFIEAARIEHDSQRRDALHATINSLPDPNYATLRALILHLNRVQEHASINRMPAGNLAICFGPTLMGSSAGNDMLEQKLQARVIETILLNTYQIFDDD